MSHTDTRCVDLAGIKLGRSFVCWSPGLNLKSSGIRIKVEAENETKASSWVVLCTQTKREEAAALWSNPVRVHKRCTLTESRSILIPCIVHGFVTSYDCHLLLKRRKHFRLYRWCRPCKRGQLLVQTVLCA